MHTLTVTPREAIGSRALRSLATSGLIPAVLYGGKKETQAITISLADFQKILRESGESAVLEVNGPGGKVQALIQEVDYNPVTSLPRHVDLLAVEKGAKMEVSIPLSFVGEAPAVKLGCRVVKVLHEIELIADAAHLPHEIEVDVSVLENDGDQIHLKDISLPAGVESKVDPEEVVALAQIAEEEPEETPALDIESIEVEQKGKEEAAE